MFILKRKKQKLISFTLLLFLLLSNFFTFLTPAFAASSPWSQTDWSGGSGQTSWSATNQYSSGSGVTTSVANQVTLAATSSWFNTSWNYRKKITFDNSAQAENLTNFPVLVKLTASNFTFSKAQSSGQDVRFTDSDGTTSLSYEIEKWDSAGTDARVWVKVPQIDASSATDYIYMYYGNSSATDGQAASSVWNSNFRAVWHLKQTGAGTTDEFTDSTSNSAHGTGGAGTSTKVPTLTSSGQINGAQTFDGSDDYITSTSNAFTVPSTFTYSLWFRPTSNPGNTNKHVMGMFSSGANKGQGQMLYRRSVGETNGHITMNVFNTAGTQTAASAVSGDVVSLNTWHHLVATFDGTVAKLYINGSIASTSANYTGTFNTSPSEPTFSIGGEGDGTTGFFTAAIMDEVRVSNTNRSANWIAATYKSESDTFNTFASEEQIYSGGSGTLTSSIFDTGQGSNFGTLTYSATTPTNTTLTVKVRTSNDSAMSGATAFSSCSSISSGSTVGGTSCATNNQRYVQYQLALANTDSISTPTFTSFSLAFTVSDATAPTISLNSVSSPTTNTKPPVTGTATEETGTVSTVEFQMDSTSGSWTACTATDGSFNAASESFTCTPTSALSDGSHTMYVRATDSNSNTTSSSSYSTATFTVDTTSPNDFSLESPSNNAYITSERPTFRWRAASNPDAISLSKYKLEIDNNGDSGDFTIDNIPVSRTSDYETSKYYIKYENFSDSDTTNNYISVNTKDSADWSKNENYGKLKEGKDQWKVLAIDSAGNSRDNSRTIYLDTQKPTITLEKLGDVSFDTSHSSWYYTKKNITLTGKSSENGTVNITFSKKGYNTSFGYGNFITAKVTTDSSNNFSWSTDVLEYGDYIVKITSTDQAGNISIPLEFNLIVDTFDNLVQKEIYKPPTITPVITPTTIQNKIPTPSITVKTTTPTPTQQPIGGPITTSPSLFDQIGNVSGSIINTIANTTSKITDTVYDGIANSIDAGSTFFSNGLTIINDGYTSITNKAPTVAKIFLSANKQATEIIADGVLASEKQKKQIIKQLYQEPISQFARLNNAIVAIIKSTEEPIANTANFTKRVQTGLETFNTIVFDKHPTYITGVKIEEIGKDYAIITWKTNHNAWGKVNYGSTISYGKEVLLLQQEKFHRAKLTGLKPGEKYYFEVMSQGNNYVYDAYYSFTTKK